MTNKSNSVSLLSAALFGATLLGATAMPTIASAGEGARNDAAVIYFTRHAEKKTTTEELGDALYTYGADDKVAGNKGKNRDDVCGLSKCAEELNALGLKRAELLADWFDDKGITDDLTHAYASHKLRTRQTIELIAMNAGLNNDNDANSDGVQELPAFRSELNPQSTKPSRQPTIDAINALQAGEVAVVAGHSGTLYVIMAALGINTDDTGDFPRDGEGKVRDFGDIWKVVIKNGKAKFKWRKNLQPTKLRVVETLPSPVVPQ